MASTEAEEPSQSFKTKTSVLRVSIHCQGCKRKVQKLLQSVPGVQEIRIEAKLQRVEVTGDVSAETLLRKLVKAGKHAELWPEKPPEIRVKETEKPKTTSQGSVSEESPVSVKEIKPPTTKTENPVEDPKRVSKTAAGSGGESAISGGKGDEGVGKREGGKESAEVKAEEKKPETTGAASNQASQPVGEKKEEQNEKDGGGGGGGGGEGKKKKKKKAQNSDKNGSSSGQPPSNGRSVNGGGGGGGSPPPTRPPTNPSPPRHNGYQYPPPHYYTPPPAPVYTVSYNTAQPPVNSYTASYYTPPPPQSYAYSHFSSQMAPPPYVPPDYDSYRQQPSDSFEMFSDENPNGCLVM
ncbi:unnamed protein product [Lactuca saligna]|uniref:HMA domain-containing protein n=1 Tax=Lactuca saligna TaxID=75948 RepID=A0AA36A2P9_LACSI|nr:unnamed protein product [Lactuca saligna]